jgi:hypothetical protein
MRRLTIGLAAVVAGLSMLVVVPAVAGVDVDGVGVVDTTSGLWYLQDPGTGDTTSFYFGNPGDFPIMGDWDGDGVETPGMYRQSDGYVYLRNSNTQGIADIRFFFGNPGDIPIAGDFDGDGFDTVSIYRPSEGRFYIINELGANEGGLGAAETDYLFGNAGDAPFVGDFDGDGVDTVGLHRESTGLVYFRNSHTEGIAESQFIYGDPGDKIVAGKWTNAQTTDTVGLFRPSQGTVYLRYDNSQGNADAEYLYGNQSMVPVAGAFGTLPGGDDPPPGVVEDEPGITGPVYAIGDSVMLGVGCTPEPDRSCLGGSYNLEKQIPDLESNAEVSRSFRSAAGLVSSRLSMAPVPQVLVIHLGTNGSPSDQDFADLMDAAKDVPRVLVLTVKQSNTANETQTNLVIRRNVPLYSNAELVDWYALAEANPSWLSVDTNYGAHLWTSAARKGYVDLIADSIAAG